jgi:hypothetical protein
MATKLAAFVGNPNIYSASEQTATTAEWNSLSAAVGQSPTMMLTYQDETHPLSQWVADAQWDVASWQASPWLAGVTPIISMPMSLQGDNADADFKAIASGAWDQTLTGILNSWASAGYSTLYLRPGWEMNGNWMDWSVTAGNAADFTAAFQHIASLAHSFTAATVKMVWSPNEGAYDPVPIANYYPGDPSVDVIAIDTYGAPVGNDTTPTAASTGANDFTLQTAISMAQAHGKPLALGETGGTDATFPTNLANVIAASGVTLDYVALWDANASGGNLIWSNNAADSAAWKAAYQQMAAASGSTGAGATSGTSGSSAPGGTTLGGSTSGTGTSGTGTSGTGTSGGGSTITTGGTISPATLTLLLSGNDFRGTPKFILKVDGQEIAGPTAVTAVHSSGQTESFSFSGPWATGTHSVEIDFVNDHYRGPVGARNLYVEQVSLNGTAYMTHEQSLSSTGVLTLKV